MFLEQHERQSPTRVQVLKKVKRFFAAESDLVKGLVKAESRLQVKYVRTTRASVPRFEVFQSALDIPDLGCASAGDALTTARYLVFHRDDTIATERSESEPGGPLFGIQFKNNPNSMILIPGGFYGSEGVLPGHIATAGLSDASIALFKSYAPVLTRGFIRIYSYWVGPQALTLLDRGGRLVRMVSTSRPYTI